MHEEYIRVVRTDVMSDNYYLLKNATQVMELPFAAALGKVADGAIRDAAAVVLFQYLKLRQIAGRDGTRA